MSDTVTSDQAAWIERVLGVRTPTGRSGGKGGEGGSFFGAVKRLFGGGPKPAPIPKSTIGPAQSARAQKLIAKMPEADQTKIQAILASAPARQQVYLEKAISSKHTLAEIETFSKAILGKNEAWLRENLHVVGNAEGKGIKQQWHDSCGPTTIQAMRGELDPIYALNLRTSNVNYTEVTKTEGDKLNPDMAREQKDMLERHSGRAVSRSETTGAGMALEGGLNDVKAATGLTFSTLDFEQDADLSPVLIEIDALLGQRLPIPMRVGDAGGGHFVLITGMAAGPPRSYAIHDPWDGKIINVTDEQFTSRKMNIAGFNAATDIYRPAADPDDTAGV